MTVLWLFSSHEFRDIWQKDWMRQNEFKKARSGRIVLPSGEVWLLISIQNQSDRYKLRGFTVDLFHNMGIEAYMNYAFLDAVEFDVPMILRPHS